jgi:DNA-directed RNA polymerase specialized sigma24 family protein
MSLSCTSRLRKRSRAVSLDESIRDPHPGPEAETEKKAEYFAVMAGLQRLPELDRAALLMSAFEGMPYAEIARALGISLAAVKMKIHRSRLTLSRLEEPNLLLLDYPAQLGPCLAAGAACWTAYFLLRRRLRATRL